MTSSNPTKLTLLLILSTLTIQTVHATNTQKCPALTDSLNGPQDVTNFPGTLSALVGQDLQNFLQDGKYNSKKEEEFIKEEKDKILNTDKLDAILQQGVILDELNVHVCVKNNSRLEVRQFDLDSNEPGVELVEDFRPIQVFAPSKQRRKPKNINREKLDPYRINWNDVKFTGVILKGPYNKITKTFEILAVAEKMTTETGLEILLVVLKISKNSRSAKISIERGVQSMTIMKPSDSDDFPPEIKGHKIKTGIYNNSPNIKAYLLIFSSKYASGQMLWWSPTDPMKLIGANPTPNTLGSRNDISSSSLSSRSRSSQHNNRNSGPKQQNNVFYKGAQVVYIFNEDIPARTDVRFIVLDPKIGKKTVKRNLPAKQVTYIIYKETNTNHISRSKISRISESKNFDRRFDIKLTCVPGGRSAKKIAKSATTIIKKLPKNEKETHILVLFEDNVVCSYSTDKIEKKIYQKLFGHDGCSSLAQGSGANLHNSFIGFTNENSMDLDPSCSEFGKDENKYDILPTTTNNARQEIEHDFRNLETYYPAYFASRQDDFFRDFPLVISSLSPEIKTSDKLLQSLSTYHHFEAEQIHAGSLVDFNNGRYPYNANQVVALSFKDGLTKLLHGQEGPVHSDMKQSPLIIFGYVKLHKDPSSSINQIIFKNNKMVYFTNEKRAGIVDMKQLNCGLYDVQMCTLCHRLPNFMGCEFNEEKQQCLNQEKYSRTSRYTKKKKCTHGGMHYELVNDFFTSENSNLELQICYYKGTTTNFQHPVKHLEVRTQFNGENYVSCKGTDEYTRNNLGAYNMDYIYATRNYVCSLGPEQLTNNNNQNLKLTFKNLPETQSKEKFEITAIPMSVLNLFTLDKRSGGITGNTKINLQIRNWENHEFFDKARPAGTDKVEFKNTIINQVQKIVFLENAAKGINPIDKQILENDKDDMKYLTCDVAHGTIYTNNMQLALRKLGEKYANTFAKSGCLANSDTCGTFSAELHFSWGEKMKIDNWDYKFTKEPRPKDHKGLTVFAMKSKPFIDEISFRNLKASHRLCKITTPIESKVSSSNDNDKKRVNHKLVHDSCGMIEQPFGDVVDSNNFTNRPSELKAQSPDQLDPIQIRFPADPINNGFGKNVDIKLYDDNMNGLFNNNPFIYSIKTLNPIITEVKWLKRAKTTKLQITGKCLLGDKIIKSVIIHGKNVDNQDIKVELADKEDDNQPDRTKNDANDAIEKLCEKYHTLEFLDEKNELNQFEGEITIYLPDACDRMAEPIRNLHVSGCNFKTILEKWTFGDTFYNTLTNFKKNKPLWIMVLIVFILLGVVSIFMYRLFRNKDSDMQYATPKIKGRIYYMKKVPEHKRVEKDQIEVDLNDYLGKGEFGVVYKARLMARPEKTKNGIGRNKNNEEEAIPLMDAEWVAVKTATSLDLKNWSEIQKFIDEAIIGIELGSHKNVLNIKGIYYPDKMDFKIEHPIYSTPVIITPFMPNGDLKSFLTKYKKSSHITVKHCIQYGLDIASGCNFLHNHKVIHRDIAARNVLINEKGVLKISDFGLCQKANEDHYNLMMTDDNKEVMFDENLPIPWLAKEIFDGHGFSDSADVWSYGVTIWEIFTRCRKPYTSLNIGNSGIPNYLAEGFRLRQPTLCPDAIYDLILRTWHPHPTKRPSFSDIITSLEKILDFHKSFGIHYNNLTELLPENADERVQRTKIVIQNGKKDIVDVEEQISRESSKKLPYKNSQYIERKKKDSRGRHYSNSEIIIEQAIFWEVDDTKGTGKGRRVPMAGTSDSPSKRENSHFHKDLSGRIITEFLPKPHVVQHNQQNTSNKTQYNTVAAASSKNKPLPQKPYAPPQPSQKVNTFNSTNTYDDNTTMSDSKSFNQNSNPTSPNSTRSLNPKSPTSLTSSKPSVKMTVSTSDYNQLPVETSSVPKDIHQQPQKNVEEMQLITDNDDGFAAPSAAPRRGRYERGSLGQF